MLQKRDPLRHFSPHFSQVMVAGAEAVGRDVGALGFGRWSRSITPVEPIGRVRYGSAAGRFVGRRYSVGVRSPSPE